MEFSDHDWIYVEFIEIYVDRQEIYIHDRSTLAANEE